MNDLEAKAKKREFWVKIVALLVAGFMVAPFIMIAIKGLIGLILGLIVGGGLIYIAPVVGRAAANARLKALKNEARKNPVETLENNYQEKKQRLTEKEKQIVTFTSKIENFRSKLTDFCNKWPAEAEKFQLILEKMISLRDLRKDKWRTANRDLVRFSVEIEKAGAIWEMGQAAADLQESAGMTEEDFFEKISTQTAINSVSESMNRAFAELDMALLESEEEKKMASSLGGAKTTQQLPPPSAPERLFVNVSAEPARVRR